VTYSGDKEMAEYGKFLSKVVIQSLFIIMDWWATVVYWLCFAVCGWWFIAYKMFDHVMLLLPSTVDVVSLYDIFTVIFIIMLVFKTLVIVKKVLEQASIDVMLIDNEPEKKIAAMDTEKSVITWRSIFIGNEFNELQSEKRTIYPTTTLIWFGFFWVGVGWGNISQTNPDFSILDNDLQPYNMFLKFFLASFLIWCIVVVQYILVFLQLRFEEPLINQFTDLCSVANISVLIRTDKIHGYYIHG